MVEYKIISLPCSLLLVYSNFVNSKREENVSKLGLLKFYIVVATEVLEIVHAMKVFRTVNIS